MASAGVSGALDAFPTHFLRRQCVYTFFAEIILAISNLSVLGFFFSVHFAVDFLPFGPNPLLIFLGLP